jgi:curved DNA-binding protein CbpA
MYKNILKDKKLLTRFIRQICALPDTPSLIQFIAGDEDYLVICSAIIDDANTDTQFAQLLTEICLKHGLDFRVLKEKLTPVSHAIGLALPSGKQIDYYELLGVSLDTGAHDIKKAFRQKARGVHPDTSSQGTKSSQEFIQLKAAYQILSDPVLRQQYDQNLHPIELWKEKANQTMIQKRPAPSKIFYQLATLFLLLIIAVFIFDFLYRQNSIFDGDTTVKQRQVSDQKALNASSAAESDRKTRPQNAKVKLFSNTSDNACKIFPTDDGSQPAKQKRNGHRSTEGSNKIDYESSPLK